MYKFIPFWFIALMLFLVGCTKTPQQVTEKAETKRLKQFFAKFHQLDLPYKMVTDPSNSASTYAVFTDLLTEHQELDSAEIFDFELNMTNKQTDSLDEEMSSNSKFKFYAIGQIYVQNKQKAVLYGRTDVETEENFVIFIATYDHEGKKVDEMIFHRPLNLLPPREIQRISEIKKDSTFTLTQINAEYKLVDEENEYMELVRQTAHERNYALGETGKMTLSTENDRELTLEEIEASRVIDSLRQTNEFSEIDTAQTPENQ